MYRSDIKSDYRFEELIKIGTLIPKPSTKTRPNGPISPWRINPAMIQQLNLDQLNIMVLELDPRMDPFETVEEATGQLTQDWTG